MGRRLAIRIVIGVVVLAVASGIGWWTNRDKPVSAKVGDCLSGASAQELKIVKCDDSSATLKVVGKVSSVAEATFDSDKELSMCKDFPTAESGYWEGEKGKTGYVLCLEPVKK